jgi:hypothetical protein
MGFFTVNFTNFPSMGPLTSNSCPFGRDSFESLPITYQFNQLDSLFPIRLHCGGCSQSGNVPVTRLSIDGSGDRASEGHPRHSTRLIDLFNVLYQNSSSIQHTHTTFARNMPRPASAAALATIMTLDSLKSSHIYSCAFNTWRQNFQSRWPIFIAGLLSENFHLPTFPYLIHQESSISNHSMRHPPSRSASSSRQILSKLLACHSCVCLFVSVDSLKSRESTFSFIDHRTVVQSYSI